MTSEEEKDEKLKHDKIIAYYSAVVNNFIAIKMERDKSLLNISTAAIAALIAYGKYKDFQGCGEKSLFILSLVMFLITTLTIIAVFNENANHLKRQYTEPGVSNKFLIIAELFIPFCFGLGVILTVVLGLLNF